MGWGSFTCYLGVEAAKANGEGLEGRDRVLEIHCEHIFADFPKLENHVLMLRSSRSVLRSCYELEVFDGSNSDSAIEVEAPALELFVPSGGFVLEDKQAFLLSRLGETL